MCRWCFHTDVFDCSILCTGARYYCGRCRDSRGVSFSALIASIVLGRRHRGHDIWGSVHASIGRERRSPVRLLHHRSMSRRATGA